MDTLDVRDLYRSKTCIQATVPSQGLAQRLQDSHSNDGEQGVFIGRRSPGWESGRQRHP
jgi:hypothetical protein